MNTRTSNQVAPSKTAYSNQQAADINIGSNCNNTRLDNTTSDNDVIALSAVGIGTGFKLTSWDYTVEGNFGTIGASKFTVDQITDVAALGDGGVTLLGHDSLRRTLAKYKAFINFIQYEAGSSGQLGNPLKFYSATIFGDTRQSSINPNSFLSNLQQQATLVNLKKSGGFVMGENTALSLIVANGVTIKLSLMGVRLVRQ